MKGRRVSGAAQETIGVPQKFCARMAAAQFCDLTKKAIAKTVRANRKRRCLDKIPEKGTRSFFLG
jgi:hypothetical protein